MILKVVTDFGKLPQLMESLNEYNFTFYNGALYISHVKCKSEKFFRKKIEGLLQGEYYIKLINDKSLKYEPIQMQDWCRKQLVWADLISYEKEHQQKLRSAMNALDRIEKFIFDENGGEADG